MRRPWLSPYKRWPRGKSDPFQPHVPEKAHTGTQQNLFHILHESRRKTPPQLGLPLPVSRCFRLVFQDLALGIIKKARCTIAFCSAPVFVHFRQVPIIKQRFAVWIPFINAFASFPALSKGFCCAHKRALQQHIGKLWKGCRQCLCMFGWFIFHRIGGRLNACGFSRRFHLKLLFAFRGPHFAQAFL